MTLNKDKIDSLLEELSKTITVPTTIIICGGASMVLNYESRESTMDIDCLKLNNQLKDNAARIAIDNGLTADWLNDNVCVTQSYSDNLCEHRTHYKDFGKLSVYLITGLPLLCMKLVSFRPESSDVSDCEKIISVLRHKYTIDDIKQTIYEIYMDMSVLGVDAELFLSQQYDSEGMFVLDEESLQSYVDMIDNKLISEDDITESVKIQIEKYRNRNDKLNTSLDKLSNL